MNDHSSTDSRSSSLAPDAVSRRAYELWEKEGRPEGCEMRHWLQAEQELGTTRADNGSRPMDSASARGTQAASSRNPSSDTRQATGSPSGGAPNSAGKQAVGAPYNREKNGSTSSSNGAKRKPTSAPAL